MHQVTIEFYLPIYVRKVNIIVIRFQKFIDVRNAYGDLASGVNHGKQVEMVSVSSYWSQSLAV
jgi:hypothetical protein